jgi:hypothetical protein
MVGLLALGKSDFEAIEPFRHDRFFKEALGITKVPSSVWLRQRLDAKGAKLRELTDELTLRLLERTQAPITAYQGYVCADLDTFVMDNSDTKKEAVSRTYQGVAGYTPIALYLGNEGWNIGLELRPGSHHSVLETEYFLERVFPRLERLCPQDAKVLLRADSGFDSARLLFAKAAERDRWAGLGRSFDFITKAEVIALYEHHGMHEQFHSEIKSDLDLERLPSGKFDTNDAILHLASFAYNCLRLLGQLGLTGEIAPIRHPAKRRRIKTVLQEIMYRTAQLVAHARRLVLDLGRNVTQHVKVFVALQERLWQAASP